ncbi:UbiA family prenyltransferase [Streptomyces sp. NPDC004647]|uniref:UbiA family prenyltransferase n=1 Tax=Streptomyces sp. NPDC004647 TaxID=3154671 RepID=UPI0033A5DC16
MASEDSSPSALLAPGYRRARGLLRACHPVPAAAVTLLVTGLALSAGRSGPGCLSVTGAVLAGQLSVGWCNDAADAHRDAAVGRCAKPVVSGAVPAGTVRSAALTALALCVLLSLASGVPAAVVHLIGVGAAWAYNLGLKATPWSWLPYAAGFGSLPAFVALGLPGHPWPHWWLVAASALLGVGAHLANVLPDIDDDLRTGVRGWPQRLGPAGARLLLPVPLVSASALLSTAGPGRAHSPGVAVVLITAGAAVGGALLGRVRPRAPFLVAIAVAAVDVVLLLWRGSGLV